MSVKQPRPEDSGASSRLGKDSSPQQQLNFWERASSSICRKLNSSSRLSQRIEAYRAAFIPFYTRHLVPYPVRSFGFENFTKIDPARSVLLVSNHRSYLDLFYISAQLWTLYGRHHQTSFPVRADFFYDNPLGLALNLMFAGGAMYPPIQRHPLRRQFNRGAMEILLAQARDCRRMIGMHPEGTRNKSLDPYTFLKPQPGCGELIYKSRPNVVPVFINGLPRTIGPLLTKRYARSRAENAVNMVMGAPLDFGEILYRPGNLRCYLTISQMVMARIADLGNQERQIRKAGLQEM